MSDAELRGIPFRAELGPRDLEGGHVLLGARVGERDERGRVVKETVGFDDLVATMGQRLDDYHDALLARAQAFRDEHTAVVDDWATFAEQVQTGFAEVLHCGRPACEDEIKAETAATPRAIMVDSEDATGTCVRCDQPSDYGKRVTFGRAY